MRRARLLSLPQRGVAFDTETWLITPDEPLPRIVCGSAGWLESGPRVTGALLDKDAALEIFAGILEDPDAIIEGANLPFDLGVVALEFARRGIDVMPHIFALLEQGRAFDLQIAEALHAIAEGHLGKDPRTGQDLKNPETGKRGSYSLSMCVDLVLGRQDAKANDEWRLRYKELDGIPIDQWPPAARDYPVDDAKNTHEVVLAQAGHMAKVSSQHDWGNVRTPDGRSASVCLSCGSTRFASQCLVRRPHLNLHQVADQTYSAFALSLGDAWGLRVDQSKVDIIEAHAIKKRAATIAPFITAGVIRDDGSESQSEVKRRVAVAHGAEEPCGICNGEGKIPHHEQPTLRCTDCKGRCQPWKSGGTIKAPTVENCATCNNTARIPHPIVKFKTCELPDGSMSCDGTGLYLTEDVPRTDKEGVGIGRDALHESGDDFLMSLGDFKEDAKTLKDYCPYLRTARVCTLCGKHGTKKYPHADDCPVVVLGASETWRDVGLKLRSNAVLETGRVSYRGYIQLFPRAPGFVDHETGQYIPSLRECIVARGPSYELVEVDENYVLQPGEYVVRGAA